MNTIICTRCKGTGEIHGSRNVGEEGMEITQDWESPCPACNGKGNINLDKVSILHISGIDKRDHPDYCDAYIEEATYNGEPASEELIEVVNNECGEMILNEIHENYLP